MSLLLIFFFFIIVVEAGQPQDQATTLLQFRASTHFLPSVRVPVSNHTLKDRLTGNFKQFAGSYDEHLLKDGLPGQPKLKAEFKQFAGNIGVDESRGRSLFYYFVESSSHSSSSPLILWLNGGPGCSSLGIGALTEIGPFGVNPDGKTLYQRQFAWNQVANLLFLESPAGVGFSYSNTTSDYLHYTNDQTTAEDSYVFLMRWFERYPSFKGRDFYLIGEDYAGYYIPQLADLILEHSKDDAMINLQGIMIGNGFIDDESDTRGLADFLWNHALISDESHEDFRQKCPTGNLHYQTPACTMAIFKILLAMGDLNYLDLYRPSCQPAHMIHPPTRHTDPCDLLFARSYLNLPHVQVALNANITKIPHTWEPCSHVIQWRDPAVTMFPIYKRLIAHGLHILIYSGDADASVPATGTRYSLKRMGLDVIKPWKKWSVPNKTEVAGYRVLYQGLSFYSFIGAGHEVSRSYPDRLYYLLNKFLHKL